MKFFPFYGLLLPCCLLLLSASQTACSRRVRPSGTEPTRGARSTVFLTEKLTAGKAAALTHLKARASLFVNDDGESIQASVQFVWHRDSALVAVVKKFGIEVARALLRPDSVMVLHRLDQTYTAKSMASFEREYNLPGGFASLQDALLGQATFVPGMNLESRVRDNLHYLLGTTEQVSAEYGLEEKSFLLRREMFLQRRDSRVLSLQFDGHKNIRGAGPFPYLRLVSLFSPETGKTEARLEFSDIDPNDPAPIRFEVPSHYRRVD